MTGTRRGGSAAAASVARWPLVAEPRPLWEVSGEGCTESAERKRPMLGSYWHVRRCRKPISASVCSPVKPGALPVLVREPLP